MFPLGRRKVTGIDATAADGAEAAGIRLAVTGRDG